MTSKLLMLTRVSLPLLAMTVLWSGAANAQFSDSVASFKIWHKPDLAKSGKVLAELSFKTPPRVNPVLNVNGANLTFSDSGTNGDVKKGDGIFSATPTMKITSFMAEQVNNTKKPFGLEEIVKVSVNSPMFEGRAVVGDDEQVKHLMSIINDPKVNKTVSQLRSLSTVLPKMTDQDLFSKLSIDAKITPAIEVIPRPKKDSLVRFIGIPAEVFSGQLSTGINPANSLMITHPTVIKDPTRTFNFCTNTGNRDGVWTFSYLMTKLAAGSGLTPEQYTLNWLNTWKTNQTLINGATATARPNVNQIISRWQANSPGGVLNIRYFPAELMAIVNRPDIGVSLSGAGGYSNNDLSRGETRLVFALLNKSANSCITMPFTVIFEYNNAATTCSTIKSWQTQWKNLGSLSLGSTTYNTELAKLTTPIVNNKNLLAHLRTNENALLSTWELREFRLGSNGQLALDPLETTPRNNPPPPPLTLIPNILASGAPTCLKDEPLLFTSSACNAAASTAPFNWVSPNYPTPLTRHRDLALNTCNGCHMNETSTSFTHIGTSKMGSGEFTLSRFLTGKNSVEALNNPTLFNHFALFTANTVSGLQPRFNDIARRQDAMADIVGMSCGRIGLPFAGVSSTNFLAIH